MKETKATNVTWHHGSVHRSDRERLLGQRGATVWLTGLSGSGKSTVAVHTEAELLRAGRACYRLDGDNVRHGLNRDLGFSESDRTENVRRVAEVARLFADAGLIVLACFISPIARDRDAARAMHADAGIPFFEVFVDVPLEVAEARDPKGLYRNARTGAIGEFTGIAQRYEPPAKPELVLRTAESSAEASAEQIIALLRAAGVFTAPA